MNARFSYSRLTASLNDFLYVDSAAESPMFKTEIIGKTVMNRNIYLITAGKGKKRLFLSGAFHGMEDITAEFLIRFAKKLLQLYKEKSEAVLKILDDISIYIVPMVNPDGVSISLNEVRQEDTFYNFLISANNVSNDFTKWQANANGVDINHNFDADWHLSREFEKEYGIFGPSPTRYAGKAPESEAESRALVSLTREKEFDMVIAFHSQGEEIYYSFGENTPPDSAKLAKEFEKASGYKAMIPKGISSFGGYKDWFINEFRRPGFTIEVGIGENPLPPQQLDEIYPKAEKIIFSAIKYLGGH